MRTTTYDRRDGMIWEATTRCRRLLKTTFIASNSWLPAESTKSTRSEALSLSPRIAVARFNAKTSALLLRERSLDARMRVMSVSHKNCRGWVGCVSMQGEAEALATIEAKR